MIRMNRSFGPFCRVLLLLLAAALFPAGAEAHAAASSAGRAEDTAAQEIAEEEPDVKRIVLGHVGDSYEWHIATAGGREWSLPLPVIVHSPSSGWHCFSAKRLRGGAEYEGLRIAADGDHAGKIVERQADGSDLRPLDLSITKTVAGLLLNSALVVALVLGAAASGLRNARRVARGRSDRTLRGALLPPFRTLSADGLLLHLPE